MNLKKLFFFIPISPITPRGILPYHAVLQFKPDVVATHTVELLHKHYRTENTEDADGNLQCNAEATEDVITGQCTHSRDAALQRLATEVPDERNGDEHFISV